MYYVKHQVFELGNGSDCKPDPKIEPNIQSVARANGSNSCSADSWILASDSVARANCSDQYIVSFARTTQTFTVYPSYFRHFLYFRWPTRTPGACIPADSCILAPELGPRANCSDQYTVSFARTTQTFTVYPSYFRHFLYFRWPTHTPGPCIPADSWILASEPVARANCLNQYTVSFARTTQTCTVYSTNFRKPTRVG